MTLGRQIGNIPHPTSYSALVTDVDRIVADIYADPASQTRCTRRLRIFMPTPCRPRISDKICMPTNLHTCRHMPTPRLGLSFMPTLRQDVHADSVFSCRPHADPVSRIRYACRQIYLPADTRDTCRLRNFPRYICRPRISDKRI
jgi:hypothetical protein